jgi:exopolysaccharide biosynthesis predicted pyruvyltransferase EpsI
VSGKKRILWVGCFDPTEHNVGDHAQTLAIEKFLEKNFSDFIIHRFYRSQVESFMKEAKHDDWIFINSSGDFGDLYPKWHRIRKKIISTFHNNLIVQLPVSVNYKNSAIFEEDKIFFRQRKNLLILCRNNEDLDLLTKNFVGCKIEFLPDFVYSLTPPSVSQERKGTLFVLRCDNESVLPSTLCSIVDRLSIPLRFIDYKLNTNLHGVFYENSRRITYGIEFSKFRHLKGDDVLCDLQTTCYDVWDDNREQVVFDIMRLYGLFNQVVTDRFHAGIFATLMKTPVQMLSSRIKGKAVVNIPNFLKYFSNFRAIVEEFDKSRRQ